MLSPCPALCFRPSLTRTAASSTFLEPRLRPALFRRQGALFTRGACWGGLRRQRWPSSCPVAMPRRRGGGGGGGGGLRQAPAASVPLASPSYYERVGQLQQALRDRYGRGTGQGVSGATESIKGPRPTISRQ